MVGAIEMQGFFFIHFLLLCHTLLFESCLVVSYFFVTNEVKPVNRLKRT